jgi:hypothetical protein
MQSEFSWFDANEKRLMPVLHSIRLTQQLFVLFDTSSQYVQSSTAQQMLLQNLRDGGIPLHVAAPALLHMQSVQLAS